jgi:hypothetical protein
MKNILIIITRYRHGGIKKSLTNLLIAIDTNKYSVDVFAMDILRSIQIDAIKLQFIGNSPNTTI